MDNWKNRESMGNMIQGSKKFAERKRDIFYDTDGISEVQKEGICVCKECAGALRIDTMSDIGNHVLAIHIPRKACDACRDQGYAWYDSDDAKAFDMVFLQDRTEDKYLQKKK